MEEKRKAPSTADAVSGANVSGKSSIVRKRRLIKRYLHDAFSIVFLTAGLLGVAVGWMSHWGVESNPAGTAAWAIGLMSLGVWLYAQHR